ncbi:hypothetical protein CWI37_0725p0010 [Hamiltosporidium tvaerminnensis]|uniref:Peptidase M48 domain-containing protein n=2 Tax=Hamiltosporidium tvaerminnensis TaxID=1176355 RepID=A0A4Q9L1W1_9MICR|nr:hypothetical protein CWI37_0725p0010 [Hamiltosporidium tvaerminnensis]
MIGTVMYKQKIQSGKNPFSELKMVTNWIENDRDVFFKMQSEHSNKKILYLNSHILIVILQLFIFSFFINDKYRNKIIGFIERKRIFEKNMFFIRSLDLCCIVMISFCAFIVDLIYLTRIYGIPNDISQAVGYARYLIIPFFYIILYFFFYKYGRLPMYLIIGVLLLIQQSFIKSLLFRNIDKLLQNYENFDINLFDDKIKRKLNEFNIEDNVYISKNPNVIKNMGVVKYFTRILVLIQGNKIEYENNPKMLNSMFSHELGHVSRGYKDMIFISLCEWLLDILIIFLIDFFSFRSRKSSKLSRFTNFFIFCLVYFLILRDYTFVFSLILKRNEEIYADKYSVTLGYGEELAYSLFKITYKFSCLQESSIYNFIKFVHPSTITRIKRICR